MLYSMVCLPSGCMRSCSFPCMHTTKAYSGVLKHPYFTAHRYFIHVGTSEIIIKYACAVPPGIRDSAAAELVMFLEFLEFRKITAEKQFFVQSVQLLPRFSATQHCLSPVQIWES